VFKIDTLDKNRPLGQLLNICWWW